MTGSAPRPRRGAVVAILAIAALVAVATTSCGVPLDDRPELITRATTPSSRPATTPTTTPSSDAEEVSVFFLSGDALEEVRYPVEGTPSLAETIGFVLAGPPEDGARGLSSAIPPGTKLNGVRVVDRRAVIDLTDSINDIDGQPEKQAFAQIAFTALAFTGVREVRFQIDGQGVDAPTDNGNQRIVTADDYDPPLNPR